MIDPRSIRSHFQIVPANLAADPVKVLESFGPSDSEAFLGRIERGGSEARGDPR